MFDITFFNFAKKDNSTARPPAGSGTTLKCAIKTPSSILSPVVEVSGDLFPGNQYPTWNYAHIPAFNGRRYFVTNKVYNRGSWEISLAEDVLASYRTTIGNTRLYITRSSARQQTALKDTVYPVTGNSKIRKDVISYGNLYPYSGGMWAVNLLSHASNAGHGTYIFEKLGQFVNFCTALQSNMADTSVSTWDSVTQSIKVTTYEPLRYIASVFWFPDDDDIPHSSTAVTSLELGNYTATGFSCYPITTSSSPSGRTWNVNIPKHPQAGDRGKWVNLAPCTEYQLLFPPYGTINLDTTAMMDASKIRINVKIDPLTGMSRCKITTDTDALLADLAGQWGVPVKISALADYNLTAGISAAVSGGMAVGAALLGDAGGAITGAMQTVKGIGDMIKGSVSTAGSTGSLVDQQTDKALFSRFFYLSEDDNANKGRPYCYNTTPAALGGYMEAQQGLFQYEQATKAEVSAVNSYLEGGFYFE